MAISPATPYALAPLGLVAAPVVAVAALVRGVPGATIAAVGVAAAAAIYTAAEGFVAVTGVLRPFERLMLGMMVRGAGSFAAIGGAVWVAGCDPRLVACVALPLYGALVAGELVTAQRLQAASAGPSPARVAVAGGAR